jgi:hypothetical protein
MARAIYPHELSDTDFTWLINSFVEAHPEYRVFECGCLPVVLIAGTGFPELDELDATGGPKELLPSQDEEPAEPDASEKT